MKRKEIKILKNTSSRHSILALMLKELAIKELRKEVDEMKIIAEIVRDSFVVLRGSDQKIMLDEIVIDYDIFFPDNWGLPPPSYLVLN